MIQIKNINISYIRQILECQNLSFPSTGLCIIKGESGSGKTSLIRCLTMETIFYDSYLYNDSPMTKTLVEEKISVLNQNQEFIEELSIQDHLKIIEKLYSFPLTKKYILRLDLNSLLDKYPNQLSGGEKTRVGLLLKIMKQADVLILDEPTASLDLHYTHIVSEIIKEYAHTHLVIVCTHDEEILKESDILYEIKDKKITVKTVNNINEAKPSDKKQENQKHFPMFLFNLKLKRRHKFYHCALFLGMAVLILISSSGISFSFGTYKNSNTFSSVYQNEILVYKGENGYGGGGYEFPLTENEIEYLKTIKHVKSVKESYIYKSITDIVVETDDCLDFSGEDVCWISLWNQDQEIRKVDYRSGKYSDTLSYCTYDENIDYSKDIDITFKNEKNGVYISKAVADILGIDEKQKDYYIEFSLMIPIYQIYGDAIFPYQNEDGTFGPDGEPLLEFLGKKEKVRLPINGILKTANMGVGINEYLGIFFSNQYMQSQMNKYKANQEIPYYWLDAKGKYVKELEEGDLSSKTIVAKPYEPILYRLQIDDVLYLDEVEKELEKQGLSTIKGDYSPKVESYEGNNDQMITVISSALLVILTLIYGILQYLHNEQEKQIKKFVESFGMKKSNQFINKKYLMDFVIMNIILCVIGVLYIGVIGPYLNYPIHFKYTFIPIALILSYVIMFIAPMLVYKLRK